jgi:hypothetical protein
VKVIKGFWKGRSRRDARSTPVRGLPPGADEVRLLESPEGLRLAELAGLLTALDQAIEAMRRLAADRKAEAGPAEQLADVALLRFAMVQFVACFKGRRGSARLTPKQAFDPAGVKFFEHVSVFADQLTGAHARVVGQTETVVLLKRAGDRVGVLGLTTRARRPERLTSMELANLAEFMTRGREAYADLFDQTRARVLVQVEELEAEDLLALPLLERVI